MNDEMFAFIFVSSSVDYEDKLKKNSQTHKQFTSGYVIVKQLQA